MIDTSPDIRVLEDGITLGYFYSPQQLEEIKKRKMLAMSIECLMFNYEEIKNGSNL